MEVLTEAMAETKAESVRGRKPTPPAAADLETLNFKVSGEFKKEFKGFAVSQGMTMLELLKEGFVLSRQKRKQ